MVKSIENRHIRDLKIDEIDNEKCDIIVVDVSFISLTSIFESMTKLIKNDGIIVTLIKPQFEVGRENIDKGGIVKDFSKHYMDINNVSNIALKFGYFLDMLTISPITGTKGNVEYLALFRYGDDNKNIDIDGIISQGKKLKKGAENDE
jgi:23S rRNA (cytidine1920-2'-O)/16S rRNA (cytidine1409-2'-O)-methyltransferase